MDAQDRKVFQLDWLAKFLFFIFGAALFVSPICILSGIFLSVHQEQMNPSFGFMILMLLVIMMVGFHVLLNVTAKLTVTSVAVIQSNLIKTTITPLSSILKVKYVYRSGGRGGADLLFIKTMSSSFYINNGIPKKMIDDAITFILEQIRIHYPENYSSMIKKMEDDAKQEESAAVANFWRK